jgi:hypothetical protein
MFAFQYGKVTSTELPALIVPAGVILKVQVVDSPITSEPELIVAFERILAVARMIILELEVSEAMIVLPFSITTCIGEVGSGVVGLSIFGSRTTKETPKLVVGIAPVIVTTLSLTVHAPTDKYPPVNEQE